MDDTTGNTTDEIRLPKRAVPQDLTDNKGELVIATTPRANQSGNVCNHDLRDPASAAEPAEQVAQFETSMSEDDLKKFISKVEYLLKITVKVEKEKGKVTRIRYDSQDDVKVRALQSVLTKELEQLPRDPYVFFIKQLCFIPQIEFDNIINSLLNVIVQVVTTGATLSNIEKCSLGSEYGFQVTTHALYNENLQNEKKFFLQKKLQVQVFTMFTDASLGRTYARRGMGGYWQECGVVHYFYIRFGRHNIQESELTKLDINCFEILAMLVAAKIWAEKFRKNVNHFVSVNCDNQTAVDTVSRGLLHGERTRQTQFFLTQFANIAEKYKFIFQPVLIPRGKNEKADKLSKGNDKRFKKLFDDHENMNFTPYHKDAAEVLENFQQQY